VYARPGEAPPPGYDHPSNRPRLVIKRRSLTTTLKHPTSLVLSVDEHAPACYWLAAAAC
jgi:hypothetical protein